MAEKTDGASHWLPRPLARPGPETTGKIGQELHTGMYYAKTSKYTYIGRYLPKPSSSSPVGRRGSILVCAASHHSWRDGNRRGFQHPGQPLSSCSIRKRNAATARLYHSPPSSLHGHKQSGRWCWPAGRGAWAWDGKLLVGTDGRLELHPILHTYIRYGRLAANRRGADLRTGGYRDPLVQCARRRRPLPGPGQCPSPAKVICRKGRGPKELQQARASVV